MLAEWVRCSVEGCTREVCIASDLTVFERRKVVCPEHQKARRIEEEMDRTWERNTREERGKKCFCQGLGVPIRRCTKCGIGMKRPPQDRG